MTARIAVFDWICMQVGINWYVGRCTWK